MTSKARADDPLRLDPELARLVERTRGLQPWRRIFHAGTGLVLTYLPAYLGINGDALLWILGGLFCALLAADLIRLRVARLNNLFFAALPALASPREAAKVASSTWYVGGVLLAYTLFPTRLAVPAVLVLALADPAASVAGRSWGRQRIGNGTVLGSLVFLAVATVVLAPFVGTPSAVAAALVATSVEVIPWRIDDNLSVPVAVATALWLLGA